MECTSWKESDVKVYQFAKIASLLGFLTAGNFALAQYPVNQGYGLTPTGYPVQPAPQPGFNTHPPVSRGWVGPAPAPNHLINWQEQSIAQEVVPGVVTPQLEGVPAPPALTSDGTLPSLNGGSVAPQDAHLQPYSHGADLTQINPNGLTVAPNAFGTGECAPACGPLSCGPTIVAPKPWFFGAGALLFNRVDDCDTRLSYDLNMPTPDLLSTGDAQIGVMPGFEITAGRYFHCGQYALAATYWGLYPETESVTIRPPVGGHLRANMPGMSDLDFPTQTAYDWYDGAEAHRLTRSSEVQNVEINLLGFGIGCASRAGVLTPGACGSGCNACVGGPTGLYVPAACSRLSLSWLAGFRYFRFEDNLEYAASENDWVYDENDIYYTNNISNDLFGFQVGGSGNYCLTKCISLYSGIKFGVYGNHMQYDTAIQTGTGVAAVIDSANAFDGTNYSYSVSDDDVALLGEWDLGTGYRINQCWSVRAGYRVLAVSGVATAVGQIPYDFVNVGHITDVDNCDALILHGAYVGAQYNF